MGRRQAGTPQNAEHHQGADDEGPSRDHDGPCPRGHASSPPKASQQRAGEGAPRRVGVVHIDSRTSSVPEPAPRFCELVTSEEREEKEDKAFGGGGGHFGGVVPVKAAPMQT